MQYIEHSGLQYNTVLLTIGSSIAAYIVPSVPVPRGRGTSFTSAPPRQLDIVTSEQKRLDHCAGSRVADIESTFTMRHEARYLLRSDSIDDVITRRNRKKRFVRSG